MRTYVKEFMERYAYPAEAQETLLSAYDQIGTEPSFVELLELYYQDVSDKKGRVEVLKPLCEKNDLSMYTASLVYFICLSKYLKAEYDKEGIDESVFYDGMDDLRCKLLECYELFGIWGVCVPGWCAGFFSKTVFALGRNQYVVSIYEGEDFVLNGQTITKGTKYLDMHIPSSGKPFDRETRLKSYDLAYNFFKKRLGEEITLFRCETWLLYAPNRELLDPKSNIISFMDDFCVIKNEEFCEAEKRRDMWRIFGAVAEKPDQPLPRNNSLQWAYADFLEAGNLPGMGTGFFFYDPVNKTTITK